jgi:hypothetical protein
LAASGRFQRARPDACQGAPGRLPPACCLPYLPRLGLGDCQPDVSTPKAPSVPPGALTISLSFAPFGQYPVALRPSFPRWLAGGSRAVSTPACEAGPSLVRPPTRASTSNIQASEPRASARRPSPSAGTRTPRHQQSNLSGLRFRDPRLSSAVSFPARPGRPRRFLLAPRSASRHPSQILGPRQAHSLLAPQARTLEPYRRQPMLGGRLGPHDRRPHELRELARVTGDCAIVRYRRRFADLSHSWSEPCPPPHPRVRSGPVPIQARTSATGRFEHRPTSPSAGTRVPSPGCPASPATGRLHYQPGPRP